MATQPAIIRPVMVRAGHLAVQTSASGATYVTLAHNVCNQVTVSNQTGVSIAVRQDGTGDIFVVPTGAFYTFFGISSTNEISFKRLDDSNSQVTLYWRWEG